MFRKTYDLLNFLTELLYPPRCPGCEEVLSSKDRQRGFCADCSKKVAFVGEVVCVKCGRPLKNEIEEYCLDCGKKARLVKQGRVIYRYSGPMKKAMYRFKYSNKRCYAKIFARHAARIYGGKINSWGVQAIVPVPMYKGKQRKRGYNQADVFADCLGRELNLPVYRNIVKREKDTSPMKMLDNTQRRSNVQNTFKLSENKVNLNKIMVVDDIYTTGSTVEAVAEQLLQGSASEIYSLCVCIGEAD